jgi:hypothetical protein
LRYCASRFGNIELGVAPGMDEGVVDWVVVPGVVCTIGAAVAGCPVDAGIAGLAGGAIGEGGAGIAAGDAVAGGGVGAAGAGIAGSADVPGIEAGCVGAYMLESVAGGGVVVGEVVVVGAVVGGCIEGLGIASLGGVMLEVSKGPLAAGGVVSCIAATSAEKEGVAVV